MPVTMADLKIERLGPCRVPSPLKSTRYVDDNDRILYHSHSRELARATAAGQPPPTLELAGPRRQVYFDSSKLKCGIVTCGGLCPGLNDVVRAIVLTLTEHYHVPTVFGFRYGYEGLVPEFGHVPYELTPDSVDDIHQCGGTVLGSSRGHQDIGQMVDTLERMNVRALFAIGGDGTLRGASAIAKEIAARRLNISVVGVPKTIDNDICFVEKTFGFETAVAESRTALASAHVESKGTPNGIGLVRLMGRHSGFIAAFAALASGDVNVCLIPEVPFELDGPNGLYAALERRLANRKHAVIVVAEGAGQHLLQADNTGACDASGNKRLQDIGLFLKHRISAHFASRGIPSSLKYIDPSYIIRSTPANAHDSVFCVHLGHCAAHAAMTGRTNMLVGFWNEHFTHMPVQLAVSRRKQVRPDGRLWQSVLELTRQEVGTTAPHEATADTDTEQDATADATEVLVETT